MHSNSIRSSALTFLTLVSIYILSPYVSICFLASYFIYYTYINIISIPVLILQLTYSPSYSLIAIDEFK